MPEQVSAPEMSTTPSTNKNSGRRQRKPLKEQPLGGYWRVPVYALAGAVLAFTVSFIFKSEYSATARLIIHPNESSYSATDSGAVTEGSVNIGGIDITKQATLGNTLVNLATSAEAANETVSRIGVDRINGGGEPSVGTVSKIVNFLKVGGTGRAQSAEEAAVSDVQGSLDAIVLDESWVMELTAWDSDPEMAELLANTAADVAVDQSATRFRENSLRELQFLTTQLEASRADVAEKAQAVAAFKSANGMFIDSGSGAVGSILTPSAPDSLAQLNTDLVGLRAREQAAREQLSSIPPTISVNTVGPDGAPVAQRQTNPEYTAQQQALDAVQVEIAVAEAKFNELAGQLGGGSAPAVNDIQVQLSALQSDLEQAQSAYDSLNSRHAAVASTVDKPRFDASRLGAVIVSNTPARPLRYLFLLVGALVGGLAGLLMTWFRSIKEEDEENSEQGAPPESSSDRNSEDRLDLRVPVVNGNGNGNGSPTKVPVPSGQLPPPPATGGGRPTPPTVTHNRSTTDRSTTDERGVLSETEANGLAWTLFHNRPMPQTRW